MPRSSKPSRRIPRAVVSSLVMPVQYFIRIESSSGNSP